MAAGSQNTRARASSLLMLVLNPANDLQAMARVWRMGQKKRVWIYRLLTTGTIEEKVYQRQLSKQGLSAAIVDDTAAQSRTFSREELKALFEVNTTTRCDTHGSIKCSCDGSAATAREKQQQFKAEAAAAAAAAAVAAAAAAAAAASAAAAAAAAATADEGADGDEGGGGNAAAAPKHQKAGDKGEGGEHGAAVDDGILRWAHLGSMADSVDPIWTGMSSWLRDKFTTYLFSDHIVNDSPQEAPGEAEEEVDEEEEAVEEEEEEGDGGAEAGYDDDG
ncbi:DNA repair and recombination protein RAD54B [Tetrabaena socialis]|uniref:DNA repair and recombination protein RAD54B n=1 Tax=Tetrabaena socialis TaxID=47790 RepID=A0A2J8AH57_9CHLO|nr:DNA repair and recombination protein RAD54B [Tetrabaena socialis]|eukprot:PNH11826.1 DNA repair and recombination protein RAD54B [Tetrabaena socialis]